jgi:hypothetical protein
MTINLRQTEVAQFTQKPWAMLDMSERKFIASRVLAARGNLETARHVEMGNPNFQQFAIVNDRLDNERLRVKV